MYVSVIFACLNINLPKLTHVLNSISIGSKSSVLSHGPIVSDSLALKHLLKGFEIIDNNLYCEKLQTAMLLLINSDEFRMACELTLSFEKELGQRVICPEVERLIRHNTAIRKRRLQ